MKKLLDFLNAMPMSDRARFAANCQKSFDYLRQIGYGNRVCREATAINIERESAGAITCEDLRPDVDWAYIRASRPTTKETP